MITPQDLAEAFGLNLRVLKMQTAGLSHRDSLLQPPFRGNCLNWVLGHIAANRDRVLAALGEAGIMSQAAARRYCTGSSPVIREEAEILRLEVLLEALQKGQAAIAARLGRAGMEEMSAGIEVSGGTSCLGERLFGLYFHDTYHTGQTEFLRQLAGMND
jgi:hypothetical protein